MSHQWPIDKEGCLGSVEEYTAGGRTPSNEEVPEKSQRKHRSGKSKNQKNDRKHRVPDDGTTASVSDRKAKTSKHNEATTRRHTEKHAQVRQGRSRDGRNFKRTSSELANEANFIEGVESVLQVTQYSSYNGRFVVSPDCKHKSVDYDQPDKLRGFGTVPKDSIKVTKERRFAEENKLNCSVDEAQDMHNNIAQQILERVSPPTVQVEDSQISSNSRYTNIDKLSVSNSVIDEKSVESQNQEIKLSSFGGDGYQEVEPGEGTTTKLHGLSDDKAVKTLWKHRSTPKDSNYQSVPRELLDTSNYNNKELKTLWKCQDKEGSMDEIVYESINKGKGKKNKKMLECTSYSTEPKKKSNHNAVYGLQDPNHVYIVAMNNGIGKNTTLPEYSTKSIAKTMTTSGDGFKQSTSSFHSENINYNFKRKNNKGWADIKDVVSKSFTAVSNLISPRRNEHKNPSNTISKAELPHEERKKNSRKETKSKARRIQRDKKTMDWTGTEIYAGIPSIQTETSSHWKPSSKPLQESSHWKPSSKPQREPSRLLAENSKDFSCVAEVFSTDPGDPSREHLRRTISQLNASRLEASPEEIYTYETIDVEVNSRTEKQINKIKQVDNAPSQHQPAEGTLNDPCGKSWVTLGQVTTDLAVMPASAHSQAASPNRESSEQTAPTIHSRQASLTYPTLNSNDFGSRLTCPILQPKVDGNEESYLPKSKDYYSSTQEQRSLYTQSSVMATGRADLILNSNDIESGQSNQHPSNNAEGPRQIYPSENASETRHMCPTQNSSMNQPVRMCPTQNSSMNQPVRMCPTQNSSMNQPVRMFPTQNSSMNQPVQKFSTPTPTGNNGGQIYPTLNSNENGYAQVYPAHNVPNEIRQGLINPTLYLRADGNGQMQQPVISNVNRKGLSYPVYPNVHGAGQSYNLYPTVNGTGYSVSPIISGPGNLMTPIVNRQCCSTNANVIGPGYSINGNINGANNPTNSNAFQSGFPVNPTNGPVYPASPVVNGSSYFATPIVGGQVNPVTCNVNGTDYSVKPNIVGTHFSVNHNKNGTVSFMDPIANEHSNHMNSNDNREHLSHFVNSNITGRETSNPINLGGNGRGIGYPVNCNGTEPGGDIPFKSESSGNGRSNQIMNANLVEQFPAMTKTVTTNHNRNHDKHVELQLPSYRHKHKSKYNAKTHSNRLSDRNAYGQTYPYGDSQVYNQSQSMLKSVSSTATSYVNSALCHPPVKGTSMQGKHSHNQDTTVPCGCGQEMRIVFALDADNTADCVICITKLKEEFSGILATYQQRGYEACCCKGAVSVTDLVMEYLKGDHYSCLHRKQSEKIIEKEKEAMRCEERRKIMEKYVEQRLKSNIVHDESSTHILPVHPKKEFKSGHRSSSKQRPVADVTYINENEAREIPRKPNRSDSYYPTRRIPRSNLDHRRTFLVGMM